MNRRAMPLIVSSLLLPLGCGGNDGGPLDLDEPTDPRSGLSRLRWSFSSSGYPSCWLPRLSRKAGRPVTQAMRR